MTTESYNYLGNGGYLKLNYHILQSFDYLQAILLCELITEYNYACKNNLNVKEYFLVNLLRLSSVLNMDSSELNKTLYELKDNGFINYYPSGFNNTILVGINEYSVVFHIQFLEQRCSFCSWDNSLKSCQNPKGKNSFCPTTKHVISNINQGSLNLEKIPSVVFSYCNMLIEDYEKQGNDVFDYPNFLATQNFLSNYKEFKSSDLVNLIELACKNEVLPQ